MSKRLTTALWIGGGILVVVVLLALYLSMGWLGIIGLLAVILAFVFMLVEKSHKYFGIGAMVLVVLGAIFIINKEVVEPIQAYQASLPTATPFDCQSVVPQAVPAHSEVKARKGTITFLLVLVNNQYQGQELIGGQSYWPLADAVLYEFPTSCRSHVDTVFIPNLGQGFWLAVSPTQTPTPLPTAQPTTTLTPGD